MTPRTPGAQSPTYYPVFLDVRGRNCVVIGGGKVAERKVLSLLKAGASVNVISPELTARLKKEKLKGSIRHASRRYRKSDLNGAFLIIIATGSYEENKKAAQDSEGKLVNVVDTPHLCSFIVPSVVKRGPLAIAISTSGASPATAKAIRKEIEKLYPARLGRHLASIKKKRAKALKEIKDKRQRERFLKSLASGKVLEKLRQPETA